MDEETGPLDPDASSREVIGAAVQACLHHDEDVAENLVTGWVCVAESVGPGGVRWLSKLSGDVNGDALASWTEQGLLHNGLFHADGFEGLPEEGDDE